MADLRSAIWTQIAHVLHEDLLAPSRTACRAEKRLFVLLVSPRESIRPSNLLPQFNIRQPPAPEDKTRKRSNALVQLVDSLPVPSSFPPHPR
jgi:hypothetical protein